MRVISVFRVALVTERLNQCIYLVNAITLFFFQFLIIFVKHNEKHVYITSISLS